MGPQHALTVAGADVATPSPATLPKGAASLGALAGSYSPGARLPVPRAGSEHLQDEGRGWLRRLSVVTAFQFVLLVTILTGIAALIIDFEPLFALTYAIGYGALAAGALLVLAAILWLLIAPGKATIAAAREWRETRDARAGLRTLGWAVCALAAAGVAIELALVAKSALGF